MTAAEIMTKKVFTVQMDDTLKQIKELFMRHRFHHVLVLEKTVLVGIISDRDVLENISPYANTAGAGTRDLKTLTKRAHQIMTRAIKSISQDTSVEEVCQILLAEEFSCLPVLSSSGDIDGIVTWRDIVKCLVERRMLECVG